MAIEQIQATKPRSEAIPLSGAEVVTMLLAMLAKDLSGVQRLSELVAFPKAKVAFKLRVETAPFEEGGKVEFEKEYVVDLGNPPDVVRILSGLPVWDTAKVLLDGYAQQVEKQVPASAELKVAAERVAGVGVKPVVKPLGGSR